MKFINEDFALFVVNSVFVLFGVFIVCLIIYGIISSIKSNKRADRIIKTYEDEINRLSDLEKEKFKDIQLKIKADPIMMNVEFGRVKYRKLKRDNKIKTKYKKLLNTLEENEFESDGDRSVHLLKIQTYLSKYNWLIDDLLIIEEPTEDMLAYEVAYELSIRMYNEIHS